MPTATNIGYLQVILGLNTAGFSSGLKTVGRQMTTSLTLPLAAVGAGAVKMATDFEKSLSKVEGLVGITGDEVAGMRGEVLKLAGETSRAPQELADALFFVTSAGLRGQAALEVLEQSARAAAAGLGSTETVADLVTSAVNAYGIEVLSASEATDILTNAVRLGKAPADQLAQSMGQVLPVASAMGVTFDQVGAAIASMTRTGTNASTAAIQLRQILASILTPAQQSEEALLDMGKSSAELRKQIRDEGLISVLQWLATQTKANKSAAESLVESMGAAFPNVRALSGALDIMGGNAEENVQIFREMKNSVGVADEAFGAAAKTASFAFNKALAEMRVTMIELGQQLLPIALKIVNAVKNMVTWFSSLSDAGQRTTLAIAGILALAGPVIGFLGTMASIVAGLVGTVGLVIVAVAALAAGILYLWDNWEAVKERISDWSWWKNMLIDMLQFFVKWNPFSAIIEGYNFIVKKLGQEGLVIENPWEGVIDALEDMKDPVREREYQFKSFGETIQSVAGKAKNALADLFNVAAGGGGGGGAGDLVPRRTTAPTQLQGRGSALGGVTAGVAEQLRGGGGPLGAPLLTNEMVGSDLANRLAIVGEKVAMVKQQAIELSQAMQTALNETFVEFGETLGNLFTGDAGASNFFQGLLGIIGGFLKALGRAAIAAGLAGEAFQKLFVNPFLAIAAGVALIALAGVFANLLKKGPGGGQPQGLQAGGFVTRGGVFRVGEDGEEIVNLPRGAAVTPHNAMASQTVHLSGTFRIQGRDLVYIIDEDARRNANIG